MAIDRKHLSALIIVFLMILSAIPTEGIENPCDMEAQVWMRLDKSDRGVFVAGYLAGVSYTVRTLDLELVSKKNRALSVEELSNWIYQHLLNNPELRTGPIGPIIWNALQSYIKVVPKK